jgi:hypothetical protein
MFVNKHTYSFFILCIEFHVARMQTKFCRLSEPHKKVERAWHKVFPTFSYCILPQEHLLSVF